ncbi:MAG: type II secretion system F family protein [Proteobacteria bacterium]|nr:MAG: type II secretion system F family protein [Pseudomonadota bacterium]
MAEYNYEGVDKSGNRVKGKITANTEGELRILLRGQGIRPVRVSVQSVATRDLGQMFKSSNITQEELLIFTRQMQVLIGSGIPLTQSLDILADQGGSSAFKNLCNGIKQKVSEGTFLWEAMGAYPKTFPKLYLALVRAGESSGALDAILRRLTNYLEDADRLKKLLKSAMMYPAIVISVGIAVIVGMLTFVIPKFEELLASNGQTLPAPTQFVINASHLIRDHFMVIIGVTAVGGFVLIKFFQSPEGRVLRDRMFFKMPIFGPIMQKGGTARFTRTLATLLNSGVNLLDAIDICKQTIDNAVLEDAVSILRPEIEQGKSLGYVFGQIKVFPKMAVQMMSVGESTGQLDRMLEKVADFYEAEVEILVNGLTKLIEPLILVFLGGTVGGLMIAMYLPIFKMGEESHEYRIEHEGYWSFGSHGHCQTTGDGEHFQCKAERVHVS